MRQTRLNQPEQLGLAYEQRLDEATRRRRGAFYTPAPLATELADTTITPVLGPPSRLRICDPAVGGGALLLAVARLLIARGVDPRHVVEHQLFGLDTDRDAVNVTRAALELLAGVPARGIAVGDGLGPDLGDGYDAVVANPPFLNQLRRDTVRTRTEALDLADRWGEAAGGYADTANLFLLRAVELVRDGGRVGIILPEPVLATRDARATRQRVGARTTLDQLWRPGLGAFDAGVRVCVAVMNVAEPPAGPWKSGDWAAMAASGDVPVCDIASDRVVGDTALVTADFRDQYYDIAAVAIDRATGTGNRLVTCGLIDPARNRWGERPARVARTSMLHPTADVAKDWAAARLVPKVMLATQTRILEAVADEAGTCLPVTPVITVVPAPERLWHTLGVLTAPPLSAWAHRLQTGAAMSADAIKLSAKQVAGLPLPHDTSAWDEGARWAQTASAAGQRQDDIGWEDALIALGRVMCDAYGVDRDAVMGWWEPRPARDPARTLTLA